ncbi:unnamed protein product [Ranitomeya imitator]|uniref:Isy1-like splicing factor n=1 Tax=Ranitomeya imitator TaxID=111125 RepID=A0ABN9MA32_9NEOB|nr:unnamed protein product [Ranitomeya imitator]
MTSSLCAALVSSFPVRRSGSVRLPKRCCQCSEDGRLWRGFAKPNLKKGKLSIIIFFKQERRPFLASECNELPKAEKWRRQIIGEISKKVAQIQNAGLGEFRIRDLNDEINKLIREKGHWESRIKELGGPDYWRIGPKMLDHEGKEVPGNRGYKYFGAAKDLPGVRELFEKEPAPPPRKTRAELMKEIDAEYYGYRDEDDGVLVPLELEEEKQVLSIPIPQVSGIGRYLRYRNSDTEIRYFCGIGYRYRIHRDV